MPGDKIIEYGFKAIGAIAGLPKKLWKSKRESEAEVKQTLMDELLLLGDQLKEADSYEEKATIREKIRRVRKRQLSFLEAKEGLLLSNELRERMMPEGPTDAALPELLPTEREAPKATPPAIAEDHFSQGNAFYAAGEYDEALSQYDEALKVSPNDPTILYYRGITLHRLMRYQEARADFNRSLKVRPDDPTTLHYRGTTLHTLQRYHEALADFNRVLELSPDHANTLYYRGITLYRLMRYQEALTDLNRFLDLRPGDPGALYARARIFSWTDRFSQALSELEEAISRDDKRRRMAREDQTFENLRSDPTLGPEFERLVTEPED